MSTEKQANMDTMFLTQTGTSDYENLWRMDVHGLEDSTCGDQSVVHSEFLEQWERAKKGGIKLPWKVNHQEVWEGWKRLRDV